MKIVIAPDSFKHSLSALEAAKAINEGIHKVEPGIETILVPMADGGEGTVQSLVDALSGKIVEIVVHDPLMRKINSFYGIIGDGKTAVIEMAAASGLPLLNDEEKNPLKTTTFGTGELIKDALEKGCRDIILGIGGSATNDGGIGMAKALGAKLFDKNGNEIGYGGEELIKIHNVELSGIDQRIKETKFTVACDVDNPLCGANGASTVYGRQKGASESDVKLLDNGLAHFAKIVEEKFGLDFKDIPGAGAAGGLGYGVLFFLRGKLQRGIDIVTKVTNLTEKISKAELVITGEGKIDYQTAHGKTPFGVAQIAKSKSIPVIAFAGSLGKNYQELYRKGFSAIFSIIDNPMSFEVAIENAPKLLENAAESFTRAWLSAIKQ